MPPVPSPLYVSCVDGKPVTRLALGDRGGARPGLPIGTVRGEGRALVYQPDRIVMIPAAEVAAFGRVYERAIAEQHLVRRSEADYLAQIEAQKKSKAAPVEPPDPDSNPNEPAAPAESSPS